MKLGRVLFVFGCPVGKRKDRCKDGMGWDKDVQIEIRGVVSSMYNCMRGGGS